MNGRRKVAVEFAAGKDAIGIPGAVELELVHAVVADELHAGIAKRRVVLRAGEREAVVHDLVTGRPSRRDALLFRLTVAAPRRHPDAGRRAVRCRGFAQLGEPVWGSRS